SCARRPPAFGAPYYQLAQAYCNPAPLQQPHPPIMVAGGGPRIVGLVARYADMYDCWPPLSQVRERYARLAEACSKIGRPYEQITRSLSVDLLWAPDAADRSARIEKAIGNPAGRDPE